MSDFDWFPLSEGHPLASLHAAVVGQAVRLMVETDHSADGGAPGRSRFRAFLDSDDFGRTQEPFLAGIYQLASDTGISWLRVTECIGQVHVEQGEIEVPDGVDIQVILALGSVVSPGGNLQIEYDSDYRRITARALSQGVPPAATPLGGMMYSAGCGVAFTDRHASGNGSGPRSLQGFRALDIAHEARRAPEMLDALERFMERSVDLDWDLQLKCRPVAEATITVLRSRLGVLARDFDIDAAN